MSQKPSTRFFDGDVVLLRFESEFLFKMLETTMKLCALQHIYLSVDKIVPWEIHDK